MPEGLTLKQRLAVPPMRAALVGDCTALVDSEVKRKSGLSGLAIKGAYGLVKAIKPGIIPESVDHLLDGFLTQLEPFYQRAAAAGALQELLIKESPAIADALLHYTDQRALSADNATMRKAYDKLRPTAKTHVQEAVPGLARVLFTHLAAADAKEASARPAQVLGQAGV